MKYLNIIILLSIFSTNCLANLVSSDEIEKYKQQCKNDLDFFQKILKNNSANYANNADLDFKKWYKEGYKNATKLIDLIGDQDDCHYVMRYYVNGFNNSHIMLRSHVKLPEEQYPGLLSLKDNSAHKIIYKNTDLIYLDEVQVGDELTHINDIPIEEYYENYLLPFYANDESEITEKAASIHSLIIDGNRFKPVPRKITLRREGESYELDLKYTELSGAGLAAARQEKQPIHSDEFKVEMVSNGVWIRIPSFFPNKQEAIYFKSMMSVLKEDLAQEEYILFDMRNNRGGESKWSRPILRNLWGDEKIKSLGKQHVYNSEWEKKLRVSKDNFAAIKPYLTKTLVNSYEKALKKRDKFVVKKWSIFQDLDYLYSNEDSSDFKAKIYVLTDGFCRSTCWDFVRDLKEMPNVTHLGQATTVQNIYSVARKESAPSNDFDYFFPTQVWIKPSHNLGGSLVPDHQYEGDMKEESKLMNWILSIVEKNLELESIDN